MEALRNVSRSTKLFILLIVLYGLLAFVLPANPITKSTYQVTDEAYKSLIFVVRLPAIAMAATAYFAFRRFLAYARQVKDTPEGESFISIAKGLGWIAWGLITPMFISSLLNAIANANRDFLSTALIVTNYMYLVVSLVAFSYIITGTHSLVHKSKVQIEIKHIRWLVGLLVIMGVLFCLLISARLQSTSLTNSFNAFYLQNWLVWGTLVAPYLYAWFIGVFAALELVLISRRTPGIIYRQALQMLAAGLVIIILSMCTLQYFRSVVPRTGHLTIGSSLVTAYAIYAANIGGSILLISGVRRLKRIEDI